MLIGCIYLPNGNPQPGPKFDYKLAWFERLIEHAATLFTTDAPVILAGDFNVVPTDFDIYNIRSWKKSVLLQPAPRTCYRRLLDQGWTDALREIHIIETRCMGICPKKATTMLNTSKPDAIMTVRKGTAIEAVMGLLR